VIWSQIYLEKKMANELQIAAVTGLTVTVQMYNGTTPVGGAISTTEVGTTGQYVGSVPGATAYGHYLLVATSVGGDNPIIGSGEIFWGGDAEINVELAMVQGLDPSNPATTTQTALTAGAVDVAITGDQQTITTLTRVG
jgi:hypothetical protein